MNHLYRSIWSEALGCWIAVSENTKRKSKCSSTRNAWLSTGLLLCSANGWALPTGGQTVVGQVTINAPATGAMQIDQTSQKAIVNWQGFSIEPNEAVNIHQPNPQAALLNRVFGQNPSQIQGQLNANGQVYLINPNGVVFSKTAQVDVGGLVASTHNIKDADFLNGVQHFTQDGPTGTVSNQGIIRTPKGGTVALIGNQVRNEGTINTPNGSTVLAAGKTVDLDFKGDGLVEVKVSEAALNVQIANKGAIQADGGRVVLTARAAGQLLDTVINQDGIIKAQGLTSRNGEIILDGGSNGVTQINGALNADGQQGGKVSIMGKQIQINNGATVTASGDNGGGSVVIGDKQNTSQTTVQETARLSVQSKNLGEAGRIEIFANMGNGTVNLAGQLDASAPKQGNGGFIDTSAAHVKIADTAKVSTKAATGKTGNWLIDPPDFTIAASGGDITGLALTNALVNTSISVTSNSGASGVNGDINVNDIVSWAANKLTLIAQRNININTDLNGSGTAQLALVYGQGGVSGDYFINNGAKVNLPAGLNFSTQLGAQDGVPVNIITSYTVITRLGTQGSVSTTDLQGMQGDLTGNYVLGANIDASATSTWNNGQGFTPVGNGFLVGCVTNQFIGEFHGLGHTINGLFINRQSTGNVGLFGLTSTGLFRDVGLVGGTVVGNSSVGSLVGQSLATSIFNVYSTANVQGNTSVGGLVGDSQQGSGISNAYATGRVQGINQVGGLVGNLTDGDVTNSFATGAVSGVTGVGGLIGNIFLQVDGNIIDSYATGSVDGINSVGGLIGSLTNNEGTVSNTYASGKVTGGTGGTGAFGSVGGLVGTLGGDNISNSFWNTQTTGQTIGVGSGNITGVTGKTTAEMQQLATFSNAGWSIANTGGSTAIWRIYEGNSSPLLRPFLIPLTITTDGLTPSFSIAGADTSGHLFGSGTTFFSDQLGFDISLIAVPPPPPPPPEPEPEPLKLKPKLPEDPISVLQTSIINKLTPTTPYMSPAPNTDLAVDDKKKPAPAVLKMKNSAGRVKKLQLSANKQFMSLLMEDGTVRIWDFQRGVQRKIQTGRKEQILTDISAVNDKGELLSISNKLGINPHDIISSVIDEKIAINGNNINNFISSDDGSLLLVNMGDNELSLWDTKQSKQLWSLDHERGVVNKLALTNNKRYAAVLTRQHGAISMSAGKLKQLTDAVDIIDLQTGKVSKSLPNVGDQVVYMQFKDNDTLQLGVSGGVLSDWSVATGSRKPAGGFEEDIDKVDNIKDTYAYVAKDGAVRVGNSQGHLHFSVENPDNPIKFVKLLDGGNKLLTVLTNGDSSLWDIASGKKALRLYSTIQGWTVMDDFGRFDGSDESIENFSWMLEETDEVQLDSFSENYYEPGLLTSVMQNQDYLNKEPELLEDGFNLPPKVVLQLADQQTSGDKVAVRLDLYDRGGGIDKIHIYQNGRLISDDSNQTQDNGDHHVMTFNVTPSAGKNTLKVIASNDKGIENSSSEISFDGKTKAYTSAMRLMTVGINDYKESALKLNYSVPDAELINDVLNNRSSAITSKKLINEKATKPQILAELKDISLGSQQDVLVIYFAGHGVALGKEWYFLPYETKLSPKVEDIVKAGVSASELSDIFKKSKIQHILLMVDSCYSGAGMEAFNTLENGQRYFSRQLSRSLGITVVTAAAKDQEATELQSLGHGVFTYLIAKELEKKDSTQPVTAHGIADIISKRLPEFSKETMGIIQEPVTYTKGNDFMLTDLLKDKK